MMDFAVVLIAGNTLIALIIYFVVSHIWQD